MCDWLKSEHNSQPQCLPLTKGTTSQTMTCVVTPSGCQPDGSHREHKPLGLWGSILIKSTAGRAIRKQRAPFPAFELGLQKSTSTHRPVWLQMSCDQLPKLMEPGLPHHEGLKLKAKLPSLSGFFLDVSWQDKQAMKTACGLCCVICSYFPPIAGHSGPLGKP